MLRGTTSSPKLLAKFNELQAAKNLPVIAGKMGIRAVERIEDQ